jgi:hypothetical protein
MDSTKKVDMAAELGIDPGICDVEKIFTGYIRPYHHPAIFLWR